MCYNVTAVARPLHLLLDILLWPSLGPLGRSCPRACQQSDSNELTVPVRLCHQLHRVVFFSSLRHSLQLQCISDKNVLGIGRSILFLLKCVLMVLGSGLELDIIIDMLAL